MGIAASFKRTRSTFPMGLHPPCHSHLVVGGLGSAPLVSGGLYGGVLDGGGPVLGDREKESDDVC